MESRRSHTILLIVILVAAVAIRLVFAFGVERGLRHETPETQLTDGYHLIAESLLTGHGYRQFESHPPTLNRPPGYPLFLYSLFRLFGRDYALVQVAQALLGALGCWLLYRLGRWAHSRELGLVAAALYALMPTAVEYAARLYSENLFLPVVLAMAYFLCRAVTDGSRFAGFLAGALWGLSLLTRGALIALPLALPIGLALHPAHRRPLRHWMRWMLPALIGACLVVTPWVARNWKLTQTFVPVSTWGWAAVYNGIQCSKRMLAWVDLGRVDQESNRQRRAIVFERLYGDDVAQAYASPREYVRHEEAARDLVIEEVRGDPLGFFGRGLIGIPFTWFQTLNPKLRVISLGLHLPMMILFVIGIVALARGDPHASARLWPALIVILFVNLFQGFLFPHARYMAPGVALSLLYSCAALLALARRVPRVD